MASITTGGEPIATRDRALRNRALVRGWLYCVLVVLFALVLVGGATRLTDSGLSITEWKPIHGVIPPLSDADWQEEFEKYRQIPEYQQINQGMSLDAFKRIFWWEWAHRILARGVGFVFALPLLFFWATGRIERGLMPKLLGILALGGLQGAIGWWMVASGLVERTDVSQYRLAMHLTLAAAIFAATMIVARGLAPHSEAEAGQATRRFAGLLVLADAGPDLSRRAGRRARRRHELQHLAADGREARARRHVHSRARCGAISSRIRRRCSSSIASAPISSLPPRSGT